MSLCAQEWEVLITCDRAFCSLKLDTCQHAEHCVEHGVQLCIDIVNLSLNLNFESLVCCLECSLQRSSLVVKILLGYIVNQLLLNILDFCFVCFDILLVLQNCSLSSLDSCVEIWSVNLAVNLCIQRCNLTINILLGSKIISYSLFQVCNTVLVFLKTDIHIVIEVCQIVEQLSVASLAIFNHLLQFGCIVINLCVKLVDLSRVAFNRSFQIRNSLIEINYLLCQIANLWVGISIGRILGFLSLLLGSSQCLLQYIELCIIPCDNVAVWILTEDGLIEVVF